MKRSELINLQLGEYLCTDSICNYKYILSRYNNKTGLIASIRKFNSSCDSKIFIFFEETKNDEESGISFLASISGLNVHSTKSSSVIMMGDIILIGKYELMHDFKFDIMHRKINAPLFSKHSFRDLKF